MADLYRDVKRALQSAGCVFHRQGKGSHEIWGHPDGYIITVPSNLKSRYTAESVMKQAGLPKNAYRGS